MFDSFEKIALDAVAALKLRELEVDGLRARVSELEELCKHVIYGFYEDKEPVFRHTNAPHELEFVMTADEANFMVSKITELCNRCTELEAALEKIRDHFYMGQSALPHEKWLQGKIEGLNEAAAIAAEALRKK